MTTEKINEKEILKDLDQVIFEGKKLVTENFNEVVNTNEFESSITNIAEKINSNDIKLNNVRQYINNLLTENNKELAFVIFFIFFTRYRRDRSNILLDLHDDFINYFSNYEISKHIRILAKYSTTTSVDSYDTLIHRTEKIINTPGSKLTNHCGVINLYAELVCEYYERNLDFKNGTDDKALLNRSLKKIDEIIEIKNYHKYHLNRGRLLVLLGKHDEGESEILKAINMLDYDMADREGRVRLYEQYLIKSSFIRAYNLNDSKYRELDKIKVNNYKMVALMTTLLGFLLGTITIFTQTPRAEDLAILMLAFLSLLLVLAGVVLLGLSIAIKENKKQLYTFDLSLIGIGTILFIISMFIIIF